MHGLPQAPCQDAGRERRASAGGQLRNLRRGHGNGRDAPEAGIFEPQNLRQSAVAFHVGG